MTSTDGKKLKALRNKAMEEIGTLDPEQVKFLMRDDIANFLYDVDARISSREKTTRGYKVSVNRKTMDVEEHTQRTRFISRDIVEASEKK